MLSIENICEYIWEDSLRESLSGQVKGEKVLIQSNTVAKINPFK